MKQSLITWNNVPYAAPPTGALRWQPPSPIEDILRHDYGSTTYNATGSELGQICVQGGPAWGSNTTLVLPNQSEDCLILNIVVPAQRKPNLLPVVLFIHGGGWIGGGATNSPSFSSFANGSAIFVSIQYRLGFYGFLGSDAVQENGTANAGLLDQQSAMKWVKKYAPRFGGDPTQIVIWAGSAGGGSALLQMIMDTDARDPLFNGVLAGEPCS